MNVGVHLLIPVVKMQNIPKQITAQEVHLFSFKQKKIILTRQINNITTLHLKNIFYDYK